MRSARGEAVQMRRLGFLVTVITLSACGGRPVQPTTTIGGAGRGAARYGVTKIKVPTGVESRVAVGLRKTGAKVVLDSQLCHAARTLVPAMDANGTASQEAIAFALSHAGVHYPVLTTAGVRVPGAHDRQLVRSLVKFLAKAYAEDPFSRLGVGIRGKKGDRRVMILLGHPQTSLKPLARRQKAGKAFEVAGRLGPGFTKPRVMVTGRTGKVKSRKTKVTGPAYRATAPCPKKGGRIQVEVLADGVTGPTVVANFPVWCGTKPARATKVPFGAGPVLGANPKASEQVVFQLLNEAREKAGLAPLRWHEKAARVGRAHCRDMKTNHFAGHVSPRTGGPKDRADRAGIAASVIQENVGVAANERYVHTGLMASPGHRKNILSTRVQSVGIGVVYDGGVIYVTQLFVGQRDVGKGAAKKQARSLARAIARRRSKAGKSALHHDSALDAIAQAIAARLATGKLKAGQASKRAFTRLKKAKLKYTYAAVEAGAADRPSRLAKSGEVTSSKVNAFGVGVAGGRYSDRKTFFVVTIYAGR